MTPLLSPLPSQVAPPSLTSHSHSQRLSKSHEFTFRILIPVAILISLLLSLTRIKAITSHYFILAHNANTSSHGSDTKNPPVVYLHTSDKVRCHNIAYEITMVRLIFYFPPDSSTSHSSLDYYTLPVPEGPHYFSCLHWVFK